MTVVLLALLLAAPLVQAQSQAMLVPPHADVGVDINGNGFYDVLRITVSLDVSVAGQFAIFVDLYDSSGTFWITGGSSFPILPVGPTTVAVDLVGRDIYNAQFDGPYNTTLQVFDDTFNQDDFGWHDTTGGPYLWTDFEPTPAVFAPPHNDLPLDPDSDLKWDFLRIEAVVDVNLPGTFTIDAEAYDTVFFNLITTATTTVTLSPGPGQIVNVDLPGGPFNANGIDGPYDVDLFLSESFGPFLDFSTHTTGLYAAADFELPDAAFAPPHSDSGIDTDSDFLFNILRVAVVVDVNKAGTYEIDATARDFTFFPIVSTTRTVTLPAGAGQIVNIDFPGWRFRAHGVNGPYDVDLTLYDSSFTLLDSDIHTTNFYLATAFETPPALLAPPHNDRGIDSDGDALFNFIELNVSLQVDVAGSYIIFADFYNSTGYPLGGNVTFVTLGAGPQVVTFWKRTLEMVVTNSSGPYTVQIALYDSSFNQMDSGVHITNLYFVSQFDPIPARFAPPHADAGEDRDTPPDGEFNVLRVDVSLQVDEAGSYVIGAQLLDNATFTPITSAFRLVNLPAGAQIVPLYFSGVPIRQSGLDGPYLVNMTLALGFGIPIDMDTHVTQPYSFLEFQSVTPGMLSGRVRSAQTSAGIPNANVRAFDYRNNVVVSSSADPTGNYSLSLHRGDWMVTYDDFLHDASLRPVTVGASTTLDVLLDPSPPFRTFANATLPTWKDLDVQFTAFLEDDIVVTRQFIDWDFGNRDQTVSQAEFDAFLDFVGFMPPTPPNSTWDFLLTDTIPYVFVPGSDSFAFLDGAAPIASTLPLRIVSSFSFQNATVPSSTIHRVLVNVSYDFPDEDGKNTLVLPSGYALASYIGAPNMIVSGIGTGTVTIDPGLDPTPFDAFDYAWIQLNVGIPETNRPVITAYNATPNPVRVDTPITIAASATDDTEIDNVRLKVWDPSGNLVIDQTLTDLGGGNFEHVFAPGIVRAWRFEITVTDFWGLTATATGGFFVYERNLPVISGVTDTPDPVEYGNPTRLAANVTDDVAVAGVNVAVRDALGALIGNFSMSFNATSGKYEYAQPFLRLGVNDYTVWATDEFGNVASASGSFAVVDTTPPALGTPSVTPDPVATGTPTLIRVTATDRAGISSVSIEVRDPSNAVVASGPMTFVSGSTYEFSFTPAVSGVFWFNITATDTSTNTAVVSDSFTSITDTAPPVANAGTDQNVPMGATVTFDGTNSTDDVGIVNYTWAFTIGTMPYTLYGARPTHTFSAAGTITVTLTVRDGLGASDTDTVLIVVRDTQPPNANAGSDQIVELGLGGVAVTFNGGASTDNVGIAEHTWTFTVGGQPVTKSGQTATHTFTAVGTIIVTLTVRDAAGNSDTDEVIITVRDTTDPTANAGPDQTVEIGATGVTVTFNGSASSDVVGIVNYTWTFTVGTTTTTLYGEKPNHAFTSVGQFTITLTVKDAQGNDATDTVTINVRDTVPPTADAGQDQAVQVGATVTFNGGASTDSARIVNYTWTFDIGTTRYTLYGPMTTHTFNAQGTVVVTLTVRDAGGNTDTDTMTVNIRTGGGVEGVPGWVYGLVAVIILAIIASALLLLRRKKAGGARPPREEAPPPSEEAPPPREETPPPEERAPPPPNE